MKTIVKELVAPDGKRKVAVDGSFGRLLDLDNPSREGLHGWQRYSMGIVHGKPDEPEQHSQSDQA